MVVHFGDRDICLWAIVMKGSAMLPNVQWHPLSSPLPLLLLLQVADGGVLPFLHNRLASPSDIFYINVGSWHRKTAEWGQAYQPALDTLGQYYNVSIRRQAHNIAEQLQVLLPTCMIVVA